MTKMTMKVPEMSCAYQAVNCSKLCPSFPCSDTDRYRTGGHCKGVIEKEVGKIEGVSSVSADPGTKDVLVRLLK